MIKLDPRYVEYLCIEAVNALGAAGEYLLDIDKPNDIKLKGSDSIGPKGGVSRASQIVTEVDVALQEIIIKLLDDCTNHYSSIGLLTEELIDDKSRFEKNLFWCIDPLDGTLPFTEGNPGYSISISLISKTGTPVVGAVYDPTADNMYFTYKTYGARKNTDEWKVSNNGSGLFTILVDRSFLDHELFSGDRNQLRELAFGLGYDDFEVIQYGGAVMNAIHAAELGDACYFKLPKEGRGGGSIWDFGATACLYNELGLFATDIYGNPLDLNRPDDTFMNHKGVLFATTSEISEAVQQFYQSIS